MPYPFFNTIIIGSGASGFAAAVRLEGSRAIITEGINCGTSRNTGSDKQTYYKLSLAGNSPDSVKEMAQTLFKGGATDGDTAYAEAAESVRCFMYLNELGVDFPRSRYGEYTGYKTDHDPSCRATSAGPYTSKFMTEALERKVKEMNVPVFDKCLAVKILKDSNGVCGLIVLNTQECELEVFACNNIIMATGGPAGIYEDSVYPISQTGFSSLALEAGAHMQNMTEWQYGISSIKPRWNVSGTYMQVLPRFISIDDKGNEYEFLSDFFNDKYEALSLIFLKGYQWPFDSQKVLEGSSVLDLLVYKEKQAGRKVYLDFTRNPFGLDKIDFSKLSSEAYEYLKKAGALSGTPIERLMKMNTPAVSIYLDKGVNIAKEYLEISLCAQHNNGGISVNKWWQTEIPGLFATGECAGTHGIVRPGGTALNAGQVGALRASMYINNTYREQTSPDNFIKIAKAGIAQQQGFINRITKNKNNVRTLLKKARHEMSLVAAAIRDKEDMERLLSKVDFHIKNFTACVGIDSKKELFLVYKLKDCLITQYAVLSAMINYASAKRFSRGSAVYTDKEGNLRKGLDEKFRFSLGYTYPDEIQELFISGSELIVEYRKRRPIPDEDNFFENVWNQYRKNKNIY